MRPVPRIVRSAAEDVLQSIKRRTQAGRDIHGRPFRRYAQFTARQKKRYAPVTLVESYRMQRALRVRRIGKNVQSVGFGADRAMEKRGRHHKYGTMKMPQRDWFGLSPSQERRISKRWETKWLKEVYRDPVFRQDKRRRLNVTIMVTL